MKKTDNEIKQRLTSILRKDSRKSITEISGELGVSRITAKKALDELIESGRIKNFTISVDEDERDLAIVHVRALDGIDVNLVNETFSLLDGSFLVIMYYENLLKAVNVPVLDVSIAKSRRINLGVGRVRHIHCDYCGAEIVAEPIRLEIMGRTYYACCPNCEKDLKKRHTQINESIQ